MTTAMTTDRTLCALHGVAHRDGTKAAIACAALTTATAATTAARVTDEHLVTVTAEMLERVTDYTDGAPLALVRHIVGQRHVLAVSDGTFGEVIADATDVADMAAYYGSLDVAVSMLTAELRLEQAAGITHINDLPAPRQGRHAAVAS